MFKPKTKLKIITVIRAETNGKPTEMRFVDDRELPAISPIAQARIMDEIRRKFHEEADKWNFYGKGD